MLLLSLWFILLSYPSAVKTQERHPVKKNTAQGYDGTKTTARRHSQTLGEGIFWKPCDIGEAKEEQKNRRILNYQGSQGVFLIFLLVTGHWLLPSPRWGFLEQSKADQFSALLRLNTLALESTAGFPVNHSPRVSGT